MPEAFIRCYSCRRRGRLSASRCFASVLISACCLRQLFCLLPTRCPMSSSSQTIFPRSWPPNSCAPRAPQASAVAVPAVASKIHTMRTTTTVRWTTPEVRNYCLYPGTSNETQTTFRRRIRRDVTDAFDGNSDARTRTWQGIQGRRPQ